MGDLSDRRPGTLATRQRILAAAQKLFALKSFDRVSMPEIAGEAGLTAGAIYRHFASKDDLFFEVVRRAVEAAPRPDEASEGKAGEDEGGEDEAAVDLARAISRYAAPELQLVRRLAVEIHHASAQHPRIALLLRQSLETQTAEMRRAIERFRPQKSGEAGMAAQALMVFVVGLMHMESVAPHLIGDEPWRQAIEAAVAALIAMPDAAGP